MRIAVGTYWGESEEVMSEKYTGQTKVKQADTEKAKELTPEQQAQRAARKAEKGALRKEAKLQAREQERAAARQERVTQRVAQRRAAKAGKKA